MTAPVRQKHPDFFERFQVMDEEGYLVSEGLRVSDADYGRTVFQNLHVDSRGRVYFELAPEPAVLLEYFDEPLVIRSVQPPKPGDGAPTAGAATVATPMWTCFAPYDFPSFFTLDSLTLDEWDRFHGRTQNGIPFVLSRAAQAEFFSLLEDFDDDSITFQGQRYEIDTWLKENLDVDDEKFWTNIYLTETPRWDLQQPSPVLVNTLPRLKLPPSRILVLGSGPGHDAAFFAEQGHFVTAVDFSPEAMKASRQQYGHFKNLTWLQADIFDLPASFNNSFDLIFEHTCYCAIDPLRRQELVQIWRRLLVDQGQLLGVFFTYDKQFGPPFGGSEWEIRARLQKGFRFLYWNRWRKSLPNRAGQELMVLAQKIAFS